MNAITKTTASTASILSERAMIVSMNISLWSGRRYDRKVTREVNSSHGASADAGRYNKALLKKEALSELQRIAGAARATFYEMTLPWISDSERIIANDGYLNLVAAINKHVAEYQNAREDFIASYQRHVDEARVMLNGMFNEADYPPVSTLRDKFKMEVKTMPIPTGDDFRVSMSEYQAERIRAEIERTVANATTEAIRDIYERVADVSAKMIERLNAYTPGTPGKRAEGTFKDSLVGNVRELISILPALNITGDPALAEIANRLAPIAEHDAQVLRDSEETRKAVAEEAQAILDHVSDFLA